MLCTNACLKRPFDRGTPSDGDFPSKASSQLSARFFHIQQRYVGGAEPDISIYIC